MIYLIILSILLLCSFLEVKNLFNKNSTSSNWAYYSIMILLIGLAGLRYRVGGDTLAYIKYFESLPSLGDLNEVDFLKAEFNPLWYLFNGIIKYVYDDFIFFQISHAVILNYVIFSFFNKYSKEHRFTLVLFYFVFYFLYFNMEILRESLAIAVFLCGLHFMLEKRWFKYYSLVIICLMIHTSAIILFALPFMKWKLTRKRFLGITIFMILLFGFNLLSFLERLNLPIQVLLKANSYLGSEINLYGVMMQSFLVIPSMIFLYLRKKYNVNEHLFENIITAYIVLGILSMFIGGAYRFLNYLSIINIIFIVDSLILFRKVSYRLNVRILINLAITLLLVNQGYFYFRDTSMYQKDTRFYNRYYPYHSIYDPVRELDREKIYYNSMEFDW